jgi:pimeloyl-ACP methyl ester carboxylesterase
MTTYSNSLTVRHSFAEVDGQRIFYRHAGDPSSPTMVLLHGFPSSSHMFRDLIPLLADRFHIIAPDMVGFGHSDAPDVKEFDYTFANLASVTEALLAQLGVSRYFLYMHDYGGPIGLRLAAKHPERVLGLVIQNANAYGDGQSQAFIDVFIPLWLQGQDTGALKMLESTTTKFQYTAGARNPGLLNPDAWTLDQALLDRPGSVDRQMALFFDYQGNVGCYQAWHAYFKAHQPKTLVTWGRGDPFFTVAGAEAYRRDLQHVEIQLIDSGHFALEEASVEIASHIKRYF